MRGSALFERKRKRARRQRDRRVAPARPAGRPAISERSSPSRTLGDMFLATTTEHTGTAVQYRDGDGWVDVSYPQLGVIVREIARGLIALGIEPGDRVSILSDTRPEWTYVDGGAICAG